MSVELVWEQRSLTIRLTGTVHAADIREYESQIWTDWRFDQLQYAIWDGRGIDEWVVDEDVIENSVAYSRGSSYTNQSIRLAFVVPNEEVLSSAKQYMRESGAVRSPWRICVFEDMDEALAWARAARA
jgi:hypothetical protein